MLVRFELDPVKPAHLEAEVVDAEFVVVPPDVGVVDDAVGRVLARRLAPETSDALPEALTEESRDPARKAFLKLEPWYTLLQVFNQGFVWS